MGLKTPERLELHSAIVETLRRLYCYNSDMKSINRVESWTSIPAHFDELNLEFLFDPDPNSLYDIPMLEPCLAIPSKLIQFGIAKAKLDEITAEDNVAMLTIEAVTLQLPFIREGLIADNY